MITSRPYSRTDIGVSVLGLYNGRLYGVNLTSGHWVYSDDGANWTDTLQSPVSNPGNGNLIQLIFHGAYQVAVSSDGKLYRNTRDAWTGWTAITVAGVPAGTTGRVDICTSNGTYLFYGNYNASLPGGAKIWRSSDNGANWTQVLDAPTARHVHAMLVDPGDSTKVYATLGDASQSGNGFYYSGDSGANWTRLSSNRYGINMAVTPGNTGLSRLMLLEGDGSAQPHIMSLDYATVSGGQAAPTNALIHPWSSTWNGTGRGLAITSDGNLFYFTTAESGAVGTRDAIWLAAGPHFDTVILLADLTGNVPAAYQKTLIYGSSGIAFNYRYKYVLPFFVDTYVPQPYQYDARSSIGPIGGAVLLPSEIIL